MSEDQAMAVVRLIAVVLFAFLAVIIAIGSTFSLVVSLRSMWADLRKKPPGVPAEDEL
jgi:hypothetical protein